MARMPGATWRPITVNFTNNGQREVRGVVVHIMAGTLAGTDSWFRNPAAQASSHFGTGKSGQLYQWVDTSDRAWAQANGNSAWLSVENEGRGGDTLTSAQLDANAKVLAWAHKTYGVPLQVTHSVNGRGLGYHAMGGASWGGHTSCPGSRIVAQLDDIVSRAKKLVSGGGDPSGGSTSRSTYTVKDGDTLSGIGAKTGVKWQTIASLNGIESPYIIKVGQVLKLKASSTATKPAKKPVVSVAHLNSARAKDIPAPTGHTTYPSEVKIVEAALKAEGLLTGKYVDGSWGTLTQDAYDEFRRKVGYRGSAATGSVGLESLKKLAARHGFTAKA